MSSWGSGFANLRLSNLRLLKCLFGLRYPPKRSMQVPKFWEYRKETTDSGLGERLC
jgi:hypothetical protein